MNSFVKAWLGEYRRISRDSGAILILLLAALIYAFFYPLPYLREVVKDVPTVVVDADHSGMSRQLVGMVSANELIDLVAEVSTIEEAEALVRSRKAHGILAIPSGFERSIRRGERVEIGAWGDASYFLVYRQVVTGLVHSTATLSAGVEIRRLQATGLNMDAAMKRRDPLPLQLTPLYNTSEGYGSFVVPAVLILILQQTLLIGIGLLGGTSQEDSRNGHPGAEIGAVSGDHGARAGALSRVLGRAAAYLMIYLVHLGIYLTVVYRVFDFPHIGGALTSMVFLLPFLLASIFLALALSSIFRTREAAMQALLFTSIPAIFISGFSWPVEAMPRLIHYLAQLLPSTSGITGFLRVRQMGASLNQVSLEWVILWALAALYLVLAVRAERVSSRRQAALRLENEDKLSYREEPAHVMAGSR